MFCRVIATQGGMPLTLPVKQAISKAVKQNLFWRGAGFSPQAVTGTQVWKEILRTEMKEKNENK